MADNQKGHFIMRVKNSRIRLILFLLLLSLSACVQQNRMTGVSGCGHVVGCAVSTVGIKAPSPRKTYVFNCSDNFSFVAQTQPDKAWLFLPSATIQLAKTGENSYRDEQRIFQIKGQDATFDEVGVKQKICTNDRQQAIWEHAKLNGADFRAVGNEPGWVLEIYNQHQIILTTNYGADRMEFELPEPEGQEQAESTLYRVSQSGHNLTLSISGDVCQDTMSGEEFSSQVGIILDGQVLNGCGRALH
jgi:uncharacterized membrane protein